VCDLLYEMCYLLIYISAISTVLKHYKSVQFCRFMFMGAQLDAFCFHLCILEKYYFAEAVIISSILKVDI
jgi:hypothetical protein